MLLGGRAVKKKYPADFVRLDPEHARFMDARRLAGVLLEGPFELIEVDYREDGDYYVASPDAWAVRLLIKGEAYGVHFHVHRREAERFTMGELAHMIEDRVVRDFVEMRRKDSIHW